MTSAFKPGDTVRLYGYPGVFQVCPASRPAVLPDQPEIGVARDGKHLWNALESSVVEHNGQPIPLRSCPTVMPAYDYPHKPQFDYSDGPKARGLEALAYWVRLQRSADPTETLPQGLETKFRSSPE